MSKKMFGALEFVEGELSFTAVYNTTNNLVVAVETASTEFKPSLTIEISVRDADGQIVPLYMIPKGGGERDDVVRIIKASALERTILILEDFEEEEEEEDTKPTIVAKVTPKEKEVIDDMLEDISKDLWTEEDSEEAEAKVMGTNKTGILCVSAIVGIFIMLLCFLFGGDDEQPAEKTQEVVTGDAQVSPKVSVAAATSTVVRDSTTVPPHTHAHNAHTRTVFNIPVDLTVAEIRATHIHSKDVTTTAFNGEKLQTKRVWISTPRGDYILPAGMDATRAREVLQSLAGQ